MAVLHKKSSSILSAIRAVCLFSRSFSLQDVTLWMSHIGANYDTTKEDTTTHLPFYVHRKLSVGCFSFIVRLVGLLWNRLSARKLQMC